VRVRVCVCVTSSKFRHSGVYATCDPPPGVGVLFEIKVRSCLTAL
jgi:hypothetical protein